MFNFMISRRLFAAVLLFGAVVPLEGCEADMTAGKSDGSTDQASNLSDCSINRDRLEIVQNPKSTLQGSVIKLHKCDRDKYNGYEERFYRDGSWEFDEYGTVLITYTGKWRIENNKVITNGEKMPEYSRNLFVNNDKIYFLESLLLIKLNEDGAVIPVTISSIEG